MRGDAAALEEDVSLVMSESELACSVGWRDEALCRGLRHELFYPVRNSRVGVRCDYRDRRDLDNTVGRPNSAPEDLCALCPVRAPCLSEAIHADMDGVWGGTTHHARAVIRTKLRERNPGLLTPGCGTLDGFWRHVREEGGDTGCKECRAAANRAGVTREERNVVPVVRSLGHASPSTMPPHRRKEDVFPEQVPLPL